MSSRRYQLSDLKAFFDRFRKESDRACAVLGRALLDDYLGRLVAKSVLPDTKLDEVLGIQAPLGTFSSRIRVARALGWLTKDHANDLNVVRDIGNDFAHGLDHEMSFDEASIRARVFNLRLPGEFLSKEHLASRPMTAERRAAFESSARRRYELGVGLMWYWLDVLIQTTEPAQEPPEFLSDAE